MSPALGVFADRNDNPHTTILGIGAIQFTVLAAVLLCSTFVPKGALSFNPEPDENLDGTEDDTPEEELGKWDSRRRKRIPELLLSKERIVLE